MGARAKSVVGVCVVAAVVLAIGLVWGQKQAARATLSVEGDGASAAQAVGGPGADGGDLTYDLVVEQIDVDQLLESGKPVIIDYGRANCPVCVNMGPMLQDAAQQLAGQAYVKFVDAEARPEVLEQTAVTQTPTQVFFTCCGEAYEPSETVKSRIAFTQGTAADGRVFTMHQGDLTAEQLGLICAELGVAFHG